MFKVLLDLIIAVIKFIGFCMIIATGVMIFKEHDYKTAGMTVGVFLITLIGSRLLSYFDSCIDGKMAGRAYDIDQKEYGIVIVSEKCMETYETDPKTGITTHPFQKELDSFGEAGRISNIYDFGVEEWNEQYLDHSVKHDPTYMVVSGNRYADHQEKMYNPFLVTTKHENVIRFLKEHRK